MRTLPLGLRIVLLVIPLAFLPLALLGGAAYYYVESATREEIDAGQQRLLADAAGQIAGRLEDAGAIGQALQNLPQVRQFTEAPRDTPAVVAGVRQAMEVSLQLPRGLSGATLIGGGDGASAVTAGSPRATPADLRAAWSATGGEGPRGGGAALIDGGTTVLVVRGAQGPRGLVLIGVEVGVRSLMDRLGPLVQAPAARLDLVDDTAGILFSIGDFGLGLPDAERAAAVGMVAATGAPGRVNSSARAIVMAAPVGEFARLDGTRPAVRPLVLVRTAQESELVDRIRELRRMALMLSATAIVFGLIGAGVIARTVVHPLNALLDMTRRIGEGQFGVSLEQARDDEIGQLVGAFNRMAAALAEFQDKLIRAETFAALGRVAATVAHEVRNPLNAMRGCIDYLRLKRPDDPIVQHHTAIIGEEIAGLDRFVTDFLRISRLEHPRRVPVDVAGLLKSHIELHELRAAELGISIELAASGPVEARADPAQLGIVIENLIVNALEATPAGGRVRAELAPSADGLTIIFADTGSGMDPSVERQLFTPFFTTKPDGAGIGLAICRRILEAHGGSIRCQTEPNVGTTFTVTLPQGVDALDENSAGSADSMKIHQHAHGPDPKA